MGTPTKRRKKNDHQSSNQPVRGLDFFFNKQQAVKKEKQVASPKEEFERLLAEEVKSTRASWTEFRKSWKKDRRFYGWGRDDKEREKRFRDYLRELGERMCIPIQFSGKVLNNSRKQTSVGQYKRPRQISFRC